MNCSVDIKLHIKTIELELEFEKKLQNTNVALRENADLQLRQALGELEKSKSEQLVLIQHVGPYRKRVEKLEVELSERNNLIEMNTGGGKEPLVITLDDDDEETEMDILEMVSNMAKYRTPNSCGQTENETSKTSSIVTNANPNGVVFVDVGNDTFETQEGTTRLTEVTRVLPFPNLSNGNSDEPVSTHEKHTLQTAPVQQSDHVSANAISGQNKSKRSTQSEESTQQNTCRFCGVQKEEMTLHVRLCHRDPISSWWWCTYCPRTFVISSALKLHYQVDHCNVRYSCGICNISYKAASTLKRHKDKLHGVAKP